MLKKKIMYILVNNIPFENDDEIAMVFNDYFCSIGNNLNSQIPSTNLDPLENLPSTNSSFYLYPVGPTEVKYHINNLKNSKQPINSISVAI